MSMKIPVLGSAFGILAAAFIGAVQPSTKLLALTVSCPSSWL
jgi:hypothetical protein